MGDFVEQYLATFSGCISVINTGMHFGWPSPSLPHLLSSDSEIPTTNSQGSWIASMSVIGSIPGASFAGYIVDKIGRKKCILLSSPLYFLAWILVAFATNIYTINFGRFIAGLADGLVYTALPMYLCEIANPQIRGFLGSLIQVSLVVGIVFINTLGCFLSIKTTALISSSLPIIHFITFYFMPESPYYLIKKKRWKQAEDNWKKLNNQKEINPNFLKIKQAVTKAEEGGNKIWKLLTVKSNRKAVFIVFGLRAVQQFCGVTAIIFYAKTIFQEMSQIVPPNVSTIIYFILQLVISIISCSLVDRIGRRPLLITSIIGSAIALIIEGLYLYYIPTASYYAWVPVLALFLYVILFNLGMGTVPVLILGEFFPTTVKAVALCSADVFFCIIVIITSKLFQILKDEVGIYSPFIVFAVCCCIGLVFIWFCVPETRGKSLEEIQEFLKGVQKEENENLIDPSLKINSYHALQ